MWELSSGIIRNTELRGSALVIDSDANEFIYDLVIVISRWETCNQEVLGGSVDTQYKISIADA